MLDDIKKTINSILEERLKSPLYGTFIVSWLIWNWKIVLLLLFVKGEDLPQGTHKVKYITENYVDPCVNFWYPFLSTAFLLTVGALLSNEAYRIKRYFRRNRIKIKQKLDRSILLTVEESFTLRGEHQRLEQGYAQQLYDETKGLNQNIEDLQSTIENLKRLQGLRFEILVASYGAGDKQVLVTQVLRDKVRNNSLQTIADNNLVNEDPAPGIRKLLMIRYVFMGKEVEVFFGEGDTVVLPPILKDAHSSSEDE